MKKLLINLRWGYHLLYQNVLNKNLLGGHSLLPTLFVYV